MRDAGRNSDDEIAELQRGRSGIGAGRRAGDPAPLVQVDAQVGKPSRGPLEVITSAADNRLVRWNVSA